MPKYLIHQRSNNPGQADRVVTKVTMNSMGVEAVTVSTLLCAGLQLTFTSLSRAQDMCRVLQSMTSLKFLSVRYADDLTIPSYESERTRMQEEQLEKLSQQRMGLGLEVRTPDDFIRPWSNAAKTGAQIAEAIALEIVSAEDPPLRKFSVGQAVESRFSRQEPYAHE